MADETEKAATAIGLADAVADAVAAPEGDDTGVEIIHDESNTIAVINSVTGDKIVEVPMIAADRRLSSQIQFWLIFKPKQTEEKR